MGKSGISVSERIPRNIKAVARSVGIAAWLDTPNAWLGLAVILQARLEPHQRAALAYVALRSLDPGHAAMTSDLATDGPEQREVTA